MIKNLKQYTVENDFKVELTIDGKGEVFKSGEDRRVDLGDGWCLVQADIMLADGTQVDAILEICEKDQGEHWQTYFFTGSGIVSQDDNYLLGALGRTRKQVYPYRYRYRAPIHCNDIHVDPISGWSR